MGVCIFGSLLDSHTEETFSQAAFLLLSPNVAFGSLLDNHVSLFFFFFHIFADRTFLGTSYDTLGVRNKIFFEITRVKIAMDTVDQYLHHINISSIFSIY